MEQVSDPDTHVEFHYESERQAFTRTFTILRQTLGESAFTYANKARTKLTGGFSVYHFEAFTIGLQPVLGLITPDNEDLLKRLAETLQQIKLDGDFATITTGGGKNSPGPLRDRIRFVRDRLRAIL